MKSVKIKSVGVEFPTNTTRVTVELTETAGIITRVAETLTLDVPGIYQNMNSELFGIVLTELKAGGFDVMTAETAE